MSQFPLLELKKCHALVVSIPGGSSLVNNFRGASKNDAHIFLTLKFAWGLISTWSWKGPLDMCRTMTDDDRCAYHPYLKLKHKYISKRRYTVCRMTLFFWAPKFCLFIRLWSLNLDFEPLSSGVSIQFGYIPHSVVSVFVCPFTNHQCIWVADHLLTIY